MLNRATLNPASLFKALVLVSTCLLTAGPAVASNPIVTHAYTADPAARVMNGRVYVVTTHDQPGQTDYSQLVDYRLFSSDDMENWQDHGIIWNSRQTAPGPTWPTRRILLNVTASITCTSPMVGQLSGLPLQTGLKGLTGTPSVGRWYIAAYPTPMSSGSLIRASSLTMTARPTCTSVVVDPVTPGSSA